MSKIRYNVNVCDHPVKNNELMIHFTKICPNNCSFCIDKMNMGVGHMGKPDVDAIIRTIDIYKDKVNTVTISGGEPCVFLDELLKLVVWIKTHTKLQIILITSLPDNCYQNKLKFFHVLNNCDNIQISLQHYVDVFAARIKGVDFKGDYDRKEFYKEILNHCGSDKVLGTINIIKQYFERDYDIIKTVIMFNQLGFKNIKICEMFDADDLYVDIPKTLGIKMNSPFASGCKTEYKNANTWNYNGHLFNGHLYIKRSCFYRTKHQKASIWDLIKMCTRWMFSKKYFFAVIHENGEIAPYWI